MLLGSKKLNLPKLLQKQYATINSMYCFPTVTCCNTLGITTNYHSPLVSPSSPPPSHHHHQHLSFNHHYHYQGGYSIRGIDCYTSPKTLLISHFFWFWWCYELGRPLENYRIWLSKLNHYPFSIILSPQSLLGSDKWTWTSDSIHYLKYSHPNLL